MIKILTLQQNFRNLSNSFINIFSILQDLNEIFLKYSFNIWMIRSGLFLTVLDIFNDESVHSTFRNKKWRNQNV